MNRPNILLSCHKCLAFFGQIIICCLLAGCEKDPVPVTTDSAIKGSVVADSSGNEAYRIKVKAKGPYGETSIITVKRDFMIEGLGNGTYCLEYSKDGYGTICHYGLQLCGGDVATAPALSLYKMPGITKIPNFIKAYVTEATSPPSPYKYIYVDLAVTNIKPTDVTVMLFMSSNKDVAWNNYEFCCPTDHGGTKNNIPYIRGTSLYLPFKSGTEIFVIGYPYNPQEYFGGRFDAYYGTPSFSTLIKTNPTNIVSFKMP